MSLASLEGALGQPLTQHDPVEIDGSRVFCSARPDDVDALADTLRLASEHDVAVVPRGGGTRLSLGNAPRRADFFVDLQSISGVTEFDASEGVCHARAGTRMGVLRTALEGSGWEVPLDVVDASSIGGVLASNAIGPRCMGWGLPRDVVLGLSVVHASGERTRCGGRVVKNVTGYDMAKLYTGSLGTLAVLDAAWLRLRPVPEVVRHLEMSLERVGAADRGIDIARHHAVRACALASAGAQYRCVVELAGDEASVCGSERALESLYGAKASSADVLDAVRDRQVESASGQMRFRIGTLPSRLGGVLEALAVAKVAHVAHPGLGLVYAVFEAQQGDGAFAVAEQAAAGGGDVCCESAPPALKEGRDVFGDLAGRLPLIRSLKERFDPKGILNPGRFAGRI